MGAGWARAFGAGIGRFAAAAAALACVGAAPSAGPGATPAAMVRFGGDQNATRVVLELNQSVHGKLVVPAADKTEAGHRVVLALPGLDVRIDPAGEGEGLVRAWSMDHVAGATTLELSLTRPARVVRRFLLAPTDGDPRYRYVMDLQAAAPAPAARPAPTRAVLSRVVEPAPAHAKKVIVIDAGHGGKDPGALGSQAEEKDLTLAAAKALKRRLERDGRYRVVLTRSDDEFVPLERRVQLARRAEADLFISLHADAGSDPSLRGATIYTLSDKGSDRVARNVMAKDDWFINVDLPSRDRSVNQILLDLTQRATKNQSSAFAELLVDKVSQQTVMLQHSHRDAGYVVLLAPDVPAVLLEMGFITNPQDEALLRDPRRRVRLMNAVGDSIDDYFAAQRRYAAR
jgi:N-acetylmuramoyl-L-alanine amidase